MASTAIRKLRALFSQHGRNRRIIGRIVLNIIFRLGAMTIQAPTHVHYLRVLIDGHLAHITVAILTVQTGRDMGAMNEVHKVWHHCHRRPMDGLSTFHI